MHFRVLATILYPTIAFFLAPIVYAQDFDERFEDWPVNLKIAGRVVVCSNVPAPATLQEALAESSQTNQVVMVCEESIQAQIENLIAAMVPDQESDEDTKPSLTIEKCLVDGTENSEELGVKLQKTIGQGGTVCLFGDVAMKAGKCFPVGKASHPNLGRGLGLLPQSALQTADELETTDKRLLSMLTSQGPCVGISLEPSTCLVLDGRKIRVFNGKALFSLPGSTWHFAKKQILVPRESRRQDPNEWWLDLTQWRRQAMERNLPPFPPAEPKTPYLENGTLFIVGGGGLPEGLIDDFVEAAGGEDARLVYVPCAEQEEVSARQSIVETWKRMGVKNATFIHTKDRIKANTSDEFLEPLRTATGIWFGGGRQWNFADSYYGTQAHRLMKEVLHRGGAIGGSSAGASIQARYLARATPIQNFKPMADGYERGGLGFISGVAIDQHFSQRGRLKDMTSLVNRYPQLLGIGIDERTAIVVRKSRADVVGSGKVYFYDRNQPVVPNETDYQALPAGASFDLANRQIIE